MRVTAIARAAGLLLLFAMFAHAQNPPPPAPIVTGIAVFGNRITKTDIILREMTVRQGDTVDAEALAYCQERVYSLGLFNRVTISYPPLDSTILLVEVDERWYLYPVPLLGVVDRDIGHWYYGLGIKHENFRGWNEKIFAGFALGYDPWVSLYYANPWIFGSEQLFFESNASFARTANKSALARGSGNNFDENRYGLSATLGKRFDPFRTVALTLAYRHYEVSEYAPGRTASPRGVDRYLEAGISARHDTRNLREYATEGMFGSAGVTKKGLGGPFDFTVYSADLRGYIPIARGTALALRGFTRVSAGASIPAYEHQYFGFSERIRGHFEEEREAESIAGLSAELRLPLVYPFYLNVSGMPMKEFALWRLGLYAALFADAGTLWNRDGAPWKGTVPGGYGCGLHLLLPYSFVLRTERAWNETGRGEWVFEIGAAF